MKVFVDTRTGENMCLIEVDNSDTVLAIKEKIKKCLRVPVSNQFLYFNDKLLLENHVHAAHLKIGPNSHLQLYVPSNRNHPIHKLHQPKQSPAPSNSTQQIIQWPDKRRSNNTQVLQTEQSPVLASNSIGQDLPSMMNMPSFRPETTQRTSHVQDFPVMVRTNQELPLTTNEIINSQDLSSMTKMPSFRPETTQKISHVQDSPVMVRSKNNQEQHLTAEEITRVQKLCPERTNEIICCQDSPVMVRTNQEQPLRTEEIINSQDSSVMVRRNNNESRSLSENEVLHGTQGYFPSVQSPEASDFFKDLNIPDLSSVMNTPILRPEITQNISHVQDSPEQPWTTEEIRWVQSLWPTRTNEIINSQDSSVMVRRNNNESRSLSEKESLHGTQGYFPSVTVESNTNQVFQTEQSDFFNEIINIPDSPAKKKIKTVPMKLTVMVKPSEESRRIPLEVNASDNVKELRKELFKMQERGELNLPQQEFVLMHNITILNETQSFERNGLTQGDTIEIEYFYQ